MDDYDRRAAALDQQSAPLRAQARAEYRKLKTLLDDLAFRLEQAKLQKEEVEFRHAVGELSDEELRDRLAAPQTALDDCETERHTLEDIKARFVDALGSVEALEADEPDDTLEPEDPLEHEEEVPFQPVAAAFPSESRLGIGLPPLRARQTQPADPALLSTMSVPNTGRRLTPLTNEFSPRPSPAEDVDDDGEGATMMVAAAAIVLIEPAALSQDFQLSSSNSIGRSDENQICLSNSGISRKHAIIKAVPGGGFAIKDLGSQNGTFVNGHRVTDQVLDDGDTIEVGSVKFVFRMPWEATPSASLGRSSIRRN
jgi:pSer/pThr/pTyr-binding forkhead associated (FHA) protein